MLKMSAWTSICRQYIEAARSSETSKSTYEGYPEIEDTTRVGGEEKSPL